MVGDNSFVHELRAMAAVELNLNASCCAQNPGLKSVYEKSQSVMGGKLFSSYTTFFLTSIGPSRFQNKITELLVFPVVQKEALMKCQGRFFAWFLCVLSSLSVLGSFIQLYYLNNGMYEYKKLFKQLVAPGTEPVSGKAIVVLWSNISGSLAQKTDHFVPLLSRKSNKRMKKKKKWTN